MLPLPGCEDDDSCDGVGEVDEVSVVDDCCSDDEETVIETVAILLAAL